MHSTALAEELPTPPLQTLLTTSSGLLRVFHWCRCGAPQTAPCGVIVKTRDCCIAQPRHDTVNARRQVATEAGDPAATRAQLRNRAALVVFQASTRYAVPIEQLQEIMCRPQNFTPQAVDGAVMVSVEWRGQSPSMIDLQRQLWPDAKTRIKPSRMLVVKVADHLVALMVDDVEMVIPPHAGVQTQVRKRAEKPCTYSLFRAPAATPAIE